MQSILKREFFSSWFWNVLLNTGSMTHLNALLWPLFFHVHHGVEPDILEDESVKGVFSARLSSRNCSPNSVLSKDFFLFKMDFVLGCIDKGLLLLLPLPPLPPLPLSRRPGFSRFVEATVPMRA